ncbi:PD40 domain-containing protein [Barnesiella sp. An55]|uniref:PD40 domain-containing protein n=1 Tax=Barnesiella sp. An55 TaxID=1965646 RepID=UPI000B3A141F|nr:PD40 domain-containing protein [Barnesiella sp. An55]OUN73370.1 hypothetical protein B5G10_04275 [Barnesiella sp. An55]HIZ27547.1 hypothetical protein [Candidatus Barnesiella merdipullorum]
MRKTFLGVLVFMSQLIFAQGIEVISTQALTLDGQGAFLPKISPKGDYILVTGDDMSGLRKFDLATGEMTTITTDRNAGFNAQFADGGSTIVYRKSEYKGRLRYTSLNSVNLQSGETKRLIKPTRNLEGVSVKDGTVLAVNNGKLVTKRIAGAKLKTIPAIPSIKNSQLYITVNGKTRQLSPNGTNVGYLWPSVSPDGTKLLYYVIDEAKAYVCNIDGSNPVSLGTLRAPVWMGNDWVVGMVDYDNGEVVTYSQIFAVTAQGTHRTALTDKSQICMYPSASDDASKIVYTTQKGEIYLMKVATSK